jgi:hypothetical protein
MNNITLTLPDKDPLARALLALQPGNLRHVFARVDDDLFVLDQWTLHHSRDELETRWSPVESEIKRYTVPLRWRIQMKLMYLRQKVFG